MKTKRYVYKQRNHGSTRYSLQAFERHGSKIGKPIIVRGYLDGKPGQEWTRVSIIGNLGRMVLTGLCWGYGGEGPRGLKHILTQLGVPETEMVKIVFENKDKQGKGEKWRYTFPSQ
jgi:hypothetical protein